MRAAGVPTAETMSVARAPCVIKADGLAAGKGVFVCRTQEELDAALPAAAALGQPLVIEELLEGREVSVFALCDGAHAIPLPPAQDFKRAFDGDEGPNTGGMGSYAPAPDVDVHELVDAVHRPVLEELARRGSPFVGVLFAGLMLTESGPQRARVQLPLRRSRRRSRSCRSSTARCSTRSRRAPRATLDGVELRAVGRCRGDRRDRGRVDIPQRATRGSPIAGIDEAEATGALVFHAGTALHDERARDERRPDPRRDGHGRDARRRARARIRGRVARSRSTARATAPTSRARRLRVA